MLRLIAAMSLAIPFLGGASFPAPAETLKPPSLQRQCVPAPAPREREISVTPLDEIRKAQKARPADLVARIAAAAAQPLGSRENPVRVFDPAGQRVYLASLRCADGRSPTYCRAGNFGHGVFGTIIDGYNVNCAGSSPEKTLIFMDMYHPEHLEEAAPPGFGIEQPKSFRLRMRRDAKGILMPDDKGDVDTLVFVADIKR